MPPFKGPRDRCARGLIEKARYQPDTTTRPKPIRGWPEEPEIFTSNRRKSIAKYPYLVRHPKMDLVSGGTGTSINAGNGGADDRDRQKVTIAVDTHIDTPRPMVPNQLFSNQELIDAQCKAGL